jgi:hypothetical protein
MRKHSFQIIKKQYDYLLPIYGNIGSQQLLHRVDRKIDKYYFIGTNEEYKELLCRCEYM